jgi:hypothetical protein
MVGIASFYAMLFINLISPFLQSSCLGNKCGIYDFLDNKNEISDSI